MIESMVKQMLLSFFLRQLAKFGEALDKAQLRADLDARIRKLIPGELFDDAMSEFAIRVLDCVFAIMSLEQEAVKVIELVEQKKYEEALTYLVNYVNNMI